MKFQWKRMKPQRYRIKLQRGFLRRIVEVYLWTPGNAPPFKGPNGDAVSAKRKTQIKDFLKSEGFNHPSLN